jgi:hypothetical protein
MGFAVWSALIAARIIGFSSTKSIPQSIAIHYIFLVPILCIFKQGWFRPEKILTLMTKAKFANPKHEACANQLNNAISPAASPYVEVCNIALSLHRQHGRDVRTACLLSAHQQPPI